MTTSFKYELIGRVVPSSWHLLAPTHQVHWQLENRAASASPVSSSQAHCGTGGDLGEGSVSVRCAELSLPHMRAPGQRSRCQGDPESLGRCLRKCELNKWPWLGLVPIWPSEQPASALLGVCGGFPPHTSPTSSIPQCEAASLSKEIRSHELSGCFPDGAAQTLSQKQYAEQSSTEPWRNAKNSTYESQHSCWNHKVLLSLRSLCYDTI